MSAKSTVTSAFWPAMFTFMRPESTSSTAAAERKRERLARVSTSCCTWATRAALSRRIEAWAAIASSSGRSSSVKAALIDTDST